MKQLAGTAQNDITFHYKDSNEAGVELMLLIVEKDYYYQDGAMHHRMKSENVRFNLSLASAKTLRSELEDIIKNLEERTKASV